jgi:hypothetical protein
MAQKILKLGSPTLTPPYRTPQLFQPCEKKKTKSEYPQRSALARKCPLDTTGPWSWSKCALLKSSQDRLSIYNANFGGAKILSIWVEVRGQYFTSGLIKLFHNLYHMCRKKRSVLRCKAVRKLFQKSLSTARECSCCKKSLRSEISSKKAHVPEKWIKRCFKELPPYVQVSNNSQLKMWQTYTNWPEKGV